MNHHLNLFKFFNESASVIFIENNLSRAFSLSLLNSTLFFNDFIQEIISDEDYQYLFSYLSNDSLFSLDIQVDIDKIKNESYRKIYAVALTSNKYINFSDFHDQKRTSNKNITDIVINIKDIVFIVEVKTSNEDCKVQLYNQISPFIEANSKDPIPIIPVCITWHKIVSLMERVNNLSKLITHESPFLRDFLRLAEIKFPNWFEPKPFNNLKFSTDENSPNHHYLVQRLKQALAHCNYPLLDYSDRLGLAVDFRWASEIIPYFRSYNDAMKDYIVFNIWPGNTKTQGYNLYNKKNINWINKTTIFIDDREYELEIVRNIKICHFNRYITGLNYYDNDIIKPIHTSNNFYNQSGLWKIGSWKEFENFMDEHFKEEFNWRSKCHWNSKIINTDRNYFTMSLGFEVSAFIPFNEFCDLDKKDEDIVNITQKVNAVITAFEKLLD